MNSASNILLELSFSWFRQQVGRRGEYLGLSQQTEEPQERLTSASSRVRNGGRNYRRRHDYCRRSGDCSHVADCHQHHDYRIHRNQPNYRWLLADVSLGWFACCCGLHRLACSWPNQVGFARALPVCFGTETPASYLFFYPIPNSIKVQNT